MRPISLTFAGLRSYRAATTIDFADLNLFAVIGDTGAGKSTIIEALCLALYAKKSWSGGAAKLEDLISDGEKLMRIELTFSAAGEVWQVTRVRRRSGAGVDKLVSLTPGGVGADGSSQVTERVTEIIGLNYDQFTRAVVLPQGRFDAMLQATEKDRNAILTSILDLDDIVATRTEVEKLGKHWAPKLAAWTTDRSHYPLDPVAAVVAAKGESDSAAKRSELLGATLRRVDEHVQQAGAVTAVRQLLRAGLDVQTDLESAEIANLRELHHRWETLDAVEAAAKRSVADATGSLKALDQRQVETLAGFKRRDDLVTARHTIDRAVDELPARLERVQQGRINVEELEGAPPAAEVAPELIADAAEQDAARREARDDHDAAVRAVELARDLWERARARVGAVAEGNEKVTAVQTAAEAAEAELATALASRGESEQLVTAALIAVREALVADAAATAAADCVSGDGCPVCARPLPDDFAPPTPSFDSATAEAALRIAETRLKAQQTAAQTAQAAHAALRSDLERLNGDVAAARAAADEAQRAAAAAGVDAESVDIEGATAALVAAREAAAQGSARAEQATNAAAVAVTRAETVAAGALTAHAKELEVARAALVQDEKAVAALTATVEGLPRALVEQPGAGADVEEGLLGRATSAAQQLSDAVAALDVIDLARADHAAARERAQQEVNDATTLIREEVRAPADETLRRVNTVLTSARSISRAVEQAAPVAGVQLEATSGTRALEEILVAADAKALGARVDAVVAATAAASSVLADGLRVLGAIDARVAETTAAVAALLAEVGCGSVDELRVEWGTAQERQRVSAAAVDETERAATKAASLDEVLAVARPFAANLEVLAIALRDQHFIAHLVDARETELLAEASRRLKAITKGRFGFVADFGVVSIASGEVRSADTLSGGERFQAALALALALVEIASRGGGRLDAVFIDEGFGSLDSSALDVALDTLGLVSGDGKMVALISHLRPVAEYVDTVLHVTKDETLGSRIALLDAESRDRMLADDTESGLTQ